MTPDTPPAIEPAAPGAEAGVAGAAPAPELGWQLARNGRQFVTVPGRSGFPIWRKGEESVEQAIARAAEAKPDRAPRSKRSREERAKAAAKIAAKLTPEAREATTRKIEEACAGILTAPAIGCAMFGDEWGANHFQVQGERFAATLARSSEHNPWLRSKLEKLTEGELAIAAVLTSVSLSAAAVGYIAPPVIKYANLSVHPRARALLGVPAEPADELAARRPSPAPPEPEPPAPVAGAVPITDALSDPEQLELLAAMVNGLHPPAAERSSTIEGDGSDAQHAGVSQPA